MPSGNAQRPGDVVTAMNGTTIEIINTDAEGRLIMADALCYAAKQNVSEMIDIATLTGSAGVALGDLAAAILGTSDKMISNFKTVAEFTGETIWQLPLYKEFKNYLKSNTADISNCSEGRLGGTCSAAKFLEQFTNKLPWVHLDIASVVSHSKTSGYKVEGMSGFGVRNLVEYVSK